MGISGKGNRNTKFLRLKKNLMFSSDNKKASMHNEGRMVVDEMKYIVQS